MIRQPRERAGDGLIDRKVGPVVPPTLPDAEPTRPFGVPMAHLDASWYR
jgi:hypothetical protein